MAENGPWDSGVTQRFIRPLVDNLIAVLQAGEVAVHAEVNGGEPMPPYSRWARSRWLTVLLPGTSPYPSCGVIPSRTRTHKDEDGKSVDQGHRLEILIEDIGSNPDNLGVSVMKRVQAAHIIIERAPLPDLFNGYPLRFQRPYWDIDHDYAQFIVDKTTSTYKQNGSLIITFTGLTEKT